MFKIILFDLDGTLTDPMIGITTCVKHALNYFGIDDKVENLTRFIGPPLVDSFTEFYGFSLDDARKAMAVYRERFSSVGKFENSVYEGIPEMLSSLKKKGIVLGIASSKPEPFVEEILQHFELFDYFDVVVGSLLDDTRTKKDEVIAEAINRIGREYTKEEAAMVGDRKFDVESAKKFGMTAVGVRYGYADEGELEAENPDFIANSVDELECFLLGKSVGQRGQV